MYFILNNNKRMKKKCLNFYQTCLALLIMMCISFSAQAQYDVIVAKDGTGNFSTVQAAIDAAPSNRTMPYVIYIKDGKYKEKITVASTKTFIHLVGQSVANTILTYDDYASKPLPGGGTVGTQNSASFTVNATDFAAQNITFENSYGDGSQAVAILVNADKAAFKNCRFLGNQDTIYTKGNGTPRHYFKNCYIDGNVDFIFGSSVALFDSCIIYAKSRTAAGSSFITAANTPQGQAYGYVFKDCKLPANTGATSYFLGRPWQNSNGSTLPYANNKTVFLNAKMGSSINVAGWTTWDGGTDVNLITYAEYKSTNFSGTLLDISQRVSWSKQLSDAEAATYTFANMFTDWNPCNTVAGFCNNTPAEIIVSNFRGTKGSSSSIFNWNLSWPIDGIKYELFKSSDRTSFTKLTELTSTNDSIINFDATDALPSPNTAFYYYLRASKNGMTSFISDTIQLSSIPTINTIGALSSFSQSLGTPSTAQMYSFSAENIVTSVTITPPINFEVSRDGTNWFTNNNPLVINSINNTITSININVRLNASALGSYSGNIVHTSANATTANIPISGSTIAFTAPTSFLLQRWPLTTNNIDDATVRNAGVIATVPTLRNLTVSNGTTVAAIPAFSQDRGMAFGTTANGDGSWGTAVGGPGGNLNRSFYVEFKVTATSNIASLKVDSIILNAAFYNTASNTKLAVVYSKNAFVSGSDSADVTGGISPTGIGLLSTANGAFATPVILANQTSGNPNNYRFALNGSTGVTVSAGETITIRLYFSCGSSSTGRYAMIKDVSIIGATTTTLPLQLLSFTGSLQNKAVQLKWNTNQEINAEKFVIEKSNDGIAFNKVATVNANNSISFNAYSFIDASVQLNNYYRLKMVDKDRSYTFSNTILVVKNEAVGVTVYPNPSINMVTLSHPSNAYQSFVRIVNSNGKNVLQQLVKANVSKTEINIQQLPKGMYFIQFENDDKQIQVTSFIKK